MKSEHQEEINKVLEIVEKHKPLVHHITNNVTVNDCANITLNWGALPVMASSPEESAQMLESATALVLNIGTLDSRQMEAMLKAGKRANKMDIPVILDPVGVGATEFRTESARKLLAELEITIIKGNRGEISILAGKTAEVKGVEAVGEYNKIEKSSAELARMQNCTVVVSGAEDIITDGDKVDKLDNGHYLMGKIVGTGCMLASTLGVFAAAASIEEISYYKAAILAVHAYDLAGEKAGAESDAPNQFKIKFMDEIYELSL